MRAKVGFLFFVLLSLLLTGFIFSNSLKTAGESRAQSGRVMELVRPILVPRFIHGETKEETEQILSFVVRKVAHFVEFGALGTCVGGSFASLSVIRKRKYLIAPGAFCVAIAFCDEFIQSFTGRTNSLKDVALDSCGSICGLIFVACVVWLLKQKGKKTVSI